MIAGLPTVDELVVALKEIQADIKVSSSSSNGNRKATDVHLCVLNGDWDLHTGADINMDQGHWGSWELSNDNDDLDDADDDLVDLAENLISQVKASIDQQ